MKKYSYCKGVSLIEALISVAIMLFILFSMFLVFNSAILSSSVVDDKVNLYDQLNDRIDNYRLTGVFDNTSSGTITFSEQQLSDPELIRFTINDSSNGGMTVSKDVAKYT
ncbi:hypothetical protein LO80_04985 [Candidatus Francisella endociliophora]|uniref:Type II secretion system protein n=1 Tax=Candidatus Francisella endociliophora TaxID=653937 RepID=A0A097ERU2_9GAMM|nr:hypothetical protein LO80_04985 [Francisella sp. FSC1006]